MSPSRLDDGTPFPALAWLTCPFLVEGVGVLESGGAASRWTRRAADERELAASLRVVDDAVRRTRALESGGFDACEDTGIAGQRDPLKVKCLHAHVALALTGFADPIGASILSELGTACPDRRCARLVSFEGDGERR